MSRITEVPLGPYAKWVEKYVDVSRAAFALLRDFDNCEIDLKDPNRSFIVSMSLQAEATSIAVRSALTNGLAVAALALLRTRLEQCVISSFLVYVPSDEGWGKYIRDVNAAAFEVTATFQDKARPSRKKRATLDEEVAELGEGASSTAHRNSDGVGPTCLL